MNAQERQELYTLRWYLNNKWGDHNSQDEALDILNSLIGENPPQNRDGNSEEANQKLLWYPAAKTGYKKAITRGSYKGGYPKGAIVHFTAGRRNGLSTGIDLQRSTKMCYFLIDENGEVAQNFPLDEWGYHAGKSKWSGLSGSVSDELVGIEVMCGGKLTEKNGKWYTWFNKEIPAKERRKVSKKDNIIAGTYHAYTEEQEDALTGLLIWLHKNNKDTFSLDLVLGHDEVSPGRKNDPGGSLSMTMKQYRTHLKSLL